MRRTWSFLAIAVLAAIVVACSAPRTPAAEAPQRLAHRAPRVVLISLDGFRADYIGRAGAVRLRELAARGVRAEQMIAAFPTKTFPNHYTIVTGLYPGEHGIVANAMWDAELGSFSLRDSLAQWEPRWWGGEPLWVTVERQGRRAASVSWPGSEAPIGGARQSWLNRYDHDRPHAEIVGQVLEWLALPTDSAPALITAYFHDVDGAGHGFGPAAAETDAAIAKVDSAVGALVDGVEALGLTHVVNFIIVSDHGMTATSIDRVIVLEELADLTNVAVVDRNPIAAIAPQPADVERVYAALRGAHPNLRIYRKGDLPAAWHFNDHPRITPIVAVADEGWSIATRGQVDRWRQDGWAQGGTHGYPPELVSMGALFLAAGPGIAEGRVVPPFQNIHVYPLMARLLSLRPAQTSGSLDSVRAVLR
jgi:predicted AlkP superfamily pyrophosphatase or phosphodiesterase